jgi:hypothetical protein
MLRYLRCRNFLYESQWLFQMHGAEHGHCNWTTPTSRINVDLVDSPLDFLELPVWNLLHPVNSQQGLIMRFPRNFQRFLMSYAGVDALASPDALTKGTISLNGGLVSVPLLRSLEASEEDGVHCESHPQTEDTFYQRRHGTSDRKLI